jgi:hypothetical protein
MSYEATAIAGTNDAGETDERSMPLQPEVILPEQFFTALRSRATGERLLAVAVLQDAIDCFQKFLFASRPRYRRLFRDAEQWIMETEVQGPADDTHPYLSFAQVCDGLGLDPDDVREHLQRWYQRQLVDIHRHAPELPGHRSGSRAHPPAPSRRRLGRQRGDTAQQQAALAIAAHASPK